MMLSGWCLSGFAVLVIFYFSLSNRPFKDDVFVTHCSPKSCLCMSRPVKPQKHSKNSHFSKKYSKPKSLIKFDLFFSKENKQHHEEPFDI